MMNRNNHRIVLEEILKVNDVKRKDLPQNVDNMAPDEQVSVELSLQNHLFLFEESISVLTSYWFVMCLKFQSNLKGGWPDHLKLVFFRSEKIEVVRGQMTEKTASITLA